MPSEAPKVRGRNHTHDLERCFARRWFDMSFRDFLDSRSFVTKRESRQLMLHPGECRSNLNGQELSRHCPVPSLIAVAAKHV